MGAIGFDWLLYFPRLHVEVVRRPRKTPDKGFNCQ